MPGSVVAPLDVSAVHIPYHFRCPISLELMTDPVTVSTGQTYDRSSIESWVATGNTTCPVTRAPLDLDQGFTLIPNHTLRRLIQEWCVAHRSLGVERIPTPKQPADPSLLRSLVAAASSSSVPSPASSIAALRRLRSLARDSDRNRLLISDFRSAIVSLVFRDGVSGTTDLALEALAVSSVLALSEEESAAVASRPDRLAWISGLLRSHPSMEVRINAAALVEAASAGTRSAELRIAIGGAEGVMEGLVAMLDRDAPRSAARVAIKALLSLCLVKQNRDRAVRAGAAEGLVGRISGGGGSDLERSDLERALATVELLCRAEGGSETVVGAAAEGARGVAAALVKVMAGRASDRAAEHAAGALLAVCGVSEAAQREAVAKGVVPQLLLMVQGGCTERAKRKAQMLLKLLWATALPGHDSFAAANSDDFQIPQLQHQHQPALLRY